MSPEGAGAGQRLFDSLLPWVPMGCLMILGLVTAVLVWAVVLWRLRRRSAARPPDSA
jgi:hypothetical protein